jgi:hypothetical protein
VIQFIFSLFKTQKFANEVKIMVELIESLKYKLRMMGVPMDGHISIFCNNAAVAINTTASELALKEKQYAFAYHCV